MTLCTIGFTRKTAEEFFALLRREGVRLILDVRLNNRGQLAGFTKGSDLPYFLRELCDCAYRHSPEFAPTKEILTGFKQGRIAWEQYAAEYDALLEERGDFRAFLAEYGRFDTVCLLCSEQTVEHCHRRLLAEKLAERFDGVTIVHL